jgi:hypothetical protein
MTVGKSTFLVCFDYGTGGIWGLVDALSADQIRALYPRLAVVDEDPPWLVEMTRAVFEASCGRNGNHWNVDVPPLLWQRLFDQK